MNKKEMEQYIKFLEKENDLLKSCIYHFKKTIGANLQPFKDNIADYEDERNKGILAVLNSFVEIYNLYSISDKIEPLKPYMCEVIKLKIVKGENNVKD